MFTPTLLVQSIQNFLFLAIVSLHKRAAVRESQDTRMRPQINSEAQKSRMLSEAGDEKGTNRREGCTGLIMTSLLLHNIFISFISMRYKNTPQIQEKHCPL